MKAALAASLRRLGVYAGVKDLGRRLLAVSPAAFRQRRRMRDFYAGFIRPGDLCFDVGANLGDRTAVFLRLGARVVAVEPQARCRRRLLRRFGRNPRVVLVPRALGAQPGAAEMKVSEADTISSLSADWIARVQASGRFAGYAWNQTERVEVTTLDALIREHGTPAFCKIDVEGFEAEVLKGLSAPLRAVSFEFTPPNTCRRRWSASAAWLPWGASGSIIPKASPCGWRFRNGWMRRRRKRFCPACRTRACSGTSMPGLNEIGAGQSFKPASMRERSLFEI